MWSLFKAVVKVEKDLKYSTIYSNRDTVSLGRVQYVPNTVTTHFIGGENLCIAMVSFF